MNMIYVALLFLVGSGSVQGYAVGYTRLYNATLKKSVDIVFDCHMWEKDLSPYEFRTLPVQEIKKRLYPTERHFLESVERIDSSKNASSTALVCETRGYDVRANVFLAHFIKLLAQRLSVITYVDADKVRNSYKCSNFKACEKAFPLSSGRIIQMICNAGKSSWRSYYDLYQKTFDKTYSYPGFWDQCRIADSEMLLHVLALPHSHVIVYCGAWHAGNIAQFLKEKAGYAEIYAHNAGVKKWKGRVSEMNPEHLWPLEHVPGEVSLEPQQPQQPKKRRGLLGAFSGFFSKISARFRG